MEIPRPSSDRRGIESESRLELVQFGKAGEVRIKQNADFELMALRNVNSHFHVEAGELTTGLDIVSRPEVDFDQIEKGKNFIYTATVAVKPDVKLGSYKGIEVAKQVVEVTDAEVDAEVDKLRDQNARSITIEDQPVQDKDIIKLDYEGSVDGVPFEGGKAENAELVIGSHTFIDNFEEQLIGMNIGDEKEINVTFPEEYHAENLKGKAAVFKCKINAITRKELPEADDEFAQEVSEFDTLAEFKEDMKKKLLESKQKETDRIIEDEAIEKISCHIERYINDCDSIEKFKALPKKFAEVKAQLMKYYK